MTEKEKQCYDLAVHYLNIIFLDNKTTDLLRSDKNFQEIITNDISIVKYFDQIESNNSNSDRFIKSFEMLTNKKFVNNDKLNFSNLNDIYDTIKYTNIYLLNTLRISIEQMDNINKSASNEASVKEESSQEIPSKNYQSDEEIIRNSGYTMHDVADQLIMSQANMILSKNIAKGKVYVYNSKPKLIPIIKYLIIGLLFIMFILSIAAFALVAKYGDQIYLNVSNLEKPIEFFSNSSITSYIFQFIFILLILAFISSSMFKNFKNDNSKYRFSWIMMSCYLILFLATTFMFSWNILINKPGESDFASGTIESAKNQIFTNAANIQIVIFVIIGLVVIFTVVGAILNPKRDEKRITKLLDQYATEIRNGQIDTSSLGGGSIFGGPFGPNGWF